MHLKAILSQKDSLYLWVGCSSTASSHEDNLRPAIHKPWTVGQIWSMKAFQLAQIAAVCAQYFHNFFTHNHT